MAFDINYDDWNHKRAKAIIDHYSHRYFYGKRILDLGAGRGEIAASLSRLGADITCVDARQENLDFIHKKHPHLKTMKIDLDYEWPFTRGQFDMVLSLGLLCHLKNHFSHIKNICSITENIVLETEVLDTNDPNTKITIYEEKTINDLSFGGEGSIVSAEHIQNRLSEAGAKFKRTDDTKLNSGPYKYDWKEINAGKVFGNRRMWFIRNDNYLHQLQENKPNTFNPANIHVDYQTQNNNQGFIQPAINNIKLRLFYNYYEDSNITRRAEIDYCLQKNVDNSMFDIIIVASDINPTFNFMFEKINRLTGPNDINIICNSDIFFDTSIRLANKIKNKEVYALSRWDWVNAGNIKFIDKDINQDAWIIRGKIENVNGDFQMGKPGCDIRLAYEFNKAGYNVINPSKSIKAMHVHNSNVRRYTEADRIAGEYLIIKPSNF
jgi:SAM-dependent methyltransferase